MIFKHKDIDIPKENPFENCKLNRKPYADLLTQIVQADSGGFVLAVDNKWGTGKTTFIKMWRQHMENAGLKTLYFNAWINDYDSDPLVAFLSELKSIIPNEREKTYKELLSKGAVVAKNIVPGLVKGVVKRYVDNDVIKDTIEEINKSALDILQSEIDNYVKKKKGLDDFRNALKQFVAKNAVGKPLIFIVDELDRCRPSYAVELLEQIKHFFNVEGIVFVLSIDKTQLSNAVKGFYGSDSIDANEYLRRFIDLEYQIPEPDYHTYLRYLYEYYRYDDFFKDDKRRHQDLARDPEQLLSTASLLFERHKLSLRQQEKLLSHARMALNMFPKVNYVFPDLFILLTFLRDQHKDFYWNIKNKRLTPQEMIDGFAGILPTTFEEHSPKSAIYLLARAVKFYHVYYKDGNYGSKLIHRDEKTNERVLQIRTIFDASYDQYFLDALDESNFRAENGVMITYLLNKIDLLENFAEAS